MRLDASTGATAGLPSTLHDATSDASDPAAPGVDAAEAALPLEGVRLMLVEDEFVLALGLSDTLTDLGADVVGPVASVEDALALVRELPEIDAAVLDVNLGHEAVYPVADALIARDVPFVFATANDPDRLPERFRGIRVCRKPFDVAEFHAALRTLRLAPGHDTAD